MPDAERGRADERARFAPLYARLDALLARAPVILAIDGPCGSGKTRLATQLADAYDGSVIHMDDFFLPPDMRTRERLAEPGGNVHVERLLTEVFAKLGEPFAYRRYDCAREAFVPGVTVRPTRLTVVEGSYSHHPALRARYTLTVALRVDAPTQRRRIRAREGEEGLARFERLWIPLENTYAAAVDLFARSDFVFDTSEE